jgi:hypothetical protein
LDIEDEPVVFIGVHRAAKIGTGTAVKIIFLEIHMKTLIEAIRVTKDMDSIQCLLLIHNRRSKLTLRGSHQHLFEIGPPSEIKHGKLNVLT